MMIKLPFLSVILACVAFSASALAQTAKEAATPQPPAAEKIEWAKGLDAAVAEAAKDNRPVITYFTFDT